MLNPKKSSRRATSRLENRFVAKSRGVAKTAALSEELNIFKPYFNSVQLLGIVPTKRQNSLQTKWSLLSKRNILVLIMIHLFLIHVTASVIYKNTMEKLSFALFYDGAMIYRLLAMVISINHFVFKFGELYKVFENTLDFFMAMPEENAKTLKRFTRVIVFLTWTYAGISVGVSTLRACLADLNQYARLRLYELQADNLPSGFLRVVIFFDMILYDTVMTFGMFSSLSYILLNQYIRLKMAAFSAFVKAKDESEVSGVSSYQNLIRIHSDLVDIVKEVDHCYSRVVFLWYSDMLTDLMFTVPSLGLGHPCKDPFHCLNFLWYVLTAGVRFILISVVAAGVHATGVDLLYGVHTWVGRSPTENWHLTVLTNVLLSKFSSAKIILTGWQCFDIDRGMILTVVSGLITYAIVLMQILTQ